MTELQEGILIINTLSMFVIMGLIGIVLLNISIIKDQKKERRKKAEEKINEKLALLRSEHSIYTSHQSGIKVIETNSRNKDYTNICYWCGSNIALNLRSVAVEDCDGTHMAHDKCWFFMRYLVIDNDFSKTAFRKAVSYYSSLLGVRGSSRYTKVGNILNETQYGLELNRGSKFIYK